MKADTPANRSQRSAHTAAWIVRIFLIVFSGAVLALGWWAHSDGSLATVMRWAAPRYAVTADGVSGSLLHGGRIARLHWQDKGLEIEAHELELTWEPWASLDGQLVLSRAAATRISVQDKRPPDPARRPGPPESLPLPFPVQVFALEVGQLTVTGATSLEASAISASYRFDGLAHQVELHQARFMQGRYSGRVSLTAGSPVRLQATLAGTLQAPLPAGVPAWPVSFSASAEGELDQLLARIRIQTAPRPAGRPRPAAAAPQAEASARIAPWASQPLLEADGNFRELDAAALWPGAPQTRLTGKFSMRPLGAAASLPSQAWAIDLNADNTLPGPWNQGKLPLNQFEAAGEYRAGASLVKRLKATVGRGELTASGRWLPPSSRAGPGRLAAKPSWDVQARVNNVNPALLHSQLAALPVNGQVRVRSDGPAIGFDLDLKAARASGTASAPTAGRSGTAPVPPYLLALQEVQAKGSWNGQRAGGTLALSSLHVRSDDAELDGQAELQPAQLGGQGQLLLKAPGLQARIDGELRRDSGGGSFSLRADNTAQALRWFKKLPGVPPAVQAAMLSGRAELTAGWTGGWLDPAVTAHFSSPSLDWRNSAGQPAPSAEASSAPRKDPDVIRLRALQATLTGRLSAAQLVASGRVEAGGRVFDAQLTADGGREPLTVADATPANWSWRGRLARLDLAMQDSALGAGQWRLATSEPVTLHWSPAGAKGSQTGFEAGSGRAVLAAPPGSPRSGTGAASPSAQAVIDWQPVRWRAGAFASAGRVTGLSMDWLELLAGPQLRDAGVSGNLMLEGHWDAVLGDTVRIEAGLARSSGDLIMQAETAERTPARVAAGIRQARLVVSSQGEAIRVAMNWESERAGMVDGQLTTQLSRAVAGEGLAGWTWAPDAPLSGRLRAELPRIGVWSVLAPPGWRLRGALSTQLTVEGTRSAPQMTGTLQANDLALRSLADGIEFGNGRLRARLDGARMRIDEFRLQGAGERDTGGVLTATGEAGWINGRPEVTLDAKLVRLRASLRADRQVTVSGDLRARLVGAATELSGKLTVDQALILLPDENTPELGDDVLVRTRRSAATGRLAPSQTGDSTTAVASERNANRSVKLQLLLDLGQAFRVKGKGIDTQLRGTLVLAGDSLAKPRVTGTISTVGGEYQAYGQRLEIERGVLRFTGAVENPSLDILAIRPNLARRVGLEILGTAMLPRVRLYSQPEMPDAEKLSWLIVGRANASGGAEAALIQQAAIALLGTKTGVMSGGMAALIGLDELSFRGASSNADGGVNQAAITLGKRFSRNFYATYERSISGAMGTLFVFYDLSQRFTIRAQAGQQGAVDLIYTLPFD